MIRVTQAPAPPMPDPNLIASQVVELLTIAIVAAVVVLAVRWVAKGPIGQAIGERLRGRRAGEVGAEADERVARLESEVSSLRGEVSDMAERLDFAERVLAERRERRLGAGS